MHRARRWLSLLGSAVRAEREPPDRQPPVFWSQGLDGTGSLTKLEVELGERGHCSSGGRGSLTSPSTLPPRPPLKHLGLTWASVAFGQSMSACKSVPNPQGPP